MSSLAGYVVEHPARVYLSTGTIFAALALTPAPSFVPLVLLLTSLRLHAKTALPRRQLWASHGVLQVLLISLAVAVVHAAPSLHALSTPAVSVIVLALISVISTSIALLVVVFSYYTERVAHTPWARITTFPAAWATAWAAVDYASPVGQLTTWSPVVGLTRYDWMREVGGQVGINWITAAWAVVLADAVGSWLVGPAPEEETGHEQIVSFASDDLSRSVPPAKAAPRASSKARHTLFLAGLLLALTAPSFFISSFPSLVASPDITPFGVACALPYPQRSGHPTGPPGLADFVMESQRLQSQANIVLWPEGALRFDSPTQREETLEHIRPKINNGSYYGISFEEFVHVDSPDGVWRAGMRRNGLVLLGWEGVVHEYYKRKIVPIAESFSLTPSSEPPTIWSLPLPPPGKKYNKTEWSPTYPFVRPIPITSSICLDFSSASSFAGLPTRPALILAPARTWHVGVGHAMWEQAKARAEETGSMVLWCDGGAGGVSGVAGRGMHEVMRVGAGSWARTVGVSWPFDERRTIFSAGGSSAALMAAWGVLGLGWVAESAYLRFSGAHDRAHGVFARVLQGARGLGSLFGSWRRDLAVIRDIGNMRSKPTRNLPPAWPSSSSPSPVFLLTGPHFDLISYDELRVSRLLGDSCDFPIFSGNPVDYQATGPSSFLARSRSSLSRLRKLSRSSRKNSSGLSLDKGSQELQPALHSEETALVLAFPRPPKLTPVSISRGARSPSRNTPIEDTASVFYDKDPFRTVESPSHEPVAVSDYDHFAQIPTTTSDPLAIHSAPYPPSITPTTGRKSFKASLKRFKSFSKANFFSSKAAPETSEKSTPADRTSPSITLPDSSSEVHSDFLPELVFGQIDFSNVFHEDERASAASPPSPADLGPSLELVRIPRIELSEATERLQAAHYERVDPRTLTQSPAASTITALSPTATPLPPHSPSWYSRNVKDLEAAKSNSPPPLYIRPPSSPPLHILPRSLLPVQSNTEYVSSEFRCEIIEPPDTPCSTTSSVTLFNNSARESFLRPSAYSSRSRPSSVNRLSVIQYRQSIAGNRESVHSIVAYGSFNCPSQGESGLEEPAQSSLNIFLVSSEPTAKPLPLRPLSLFNSDQPLFSLPSLPPSPIRETPQPTTSYSIFLPSPQAFKDSPFDHFPIPTHLLALVKGIFRGSKLVSDFSMDTFGKQTDTVDYGGEVDYADYEWFKDPPPRPEPPAPPPVMDNYVPLPGVIEQNEMFDFALKSAPNVLFARFKQYGQLGVLAWCSEFGEMIEALKVLGFEGNMFVSTRTQALKTCEEILKLKLDLEMQIIVMYLSSQVARLRRFLDGDRQWDDYPKPQFPLDPYASQS
ncbi:hypothetical protein A0H81_00796 [Grifola frondosa]|uniref:CN hydrolase domain-containing protein n=1 Tax=Grifola frondosa TaxID=5627 RepID=A0A1C7MRT6_GRIFR|nr:hypothetical protein A0H81_00796 [Grifola frondosa]